MAADTHPARVKTVQTLALIKVERICKQKACREIGRTAVVLSV
jgi:hypothetical protein